MEQSTSAVNETQNVEEQWERIKQTAHVVASTMSTEGKQKQKNGLTRKEAIQNRAQAKLK